MVFNVRIASFNCRSLKSSIDEIRQLCASYDVILLQETWLLDIECLKLDTISCDFYSKGTFSMDSSTDILCGRPYGGMAILWRKTIAHFCSVTISEERIMGISIGSSLNKLLVLNVYLPYDDGTNRDDFVYYLSKIDSYIEDACTPYVVVLGDYNANLKGSASRFGKELQAFCRDANLIISDVVYNTDRDRFTFYSEAHNTCHWLDHIVATQSAHNIISDVSVLYDFITSDHLPLCCELELDLAVEPLTDEQRGPGHIKPGLFSGINCRCRILSTIGSLLVCC